MSLKSHQLQAEFARRRELEHIQTKRTEDVNRYYSHWGNVNTRFEQWTAPEYYKQAEEQLKKRKDNKEKQEKLAQRREKLRTQLNTERAAEEQEQREKERSKSRTTSTATLKKIEAKAKERENVKRKLEMEAKLYGQWRHGVNDPNLIFDTKTDNETLAKLNWIDKQIEEQMQREKEEAIAQERNLRLQQEISKTEQTQKERQLIREQEIKEIRALQENHMEALKERKEEGEILKKEEICLRDFLKELDKESELLEASSAVTLVPTEMSQAYNLKKIKVFIRQRSDVFRKQIKIALDILKRLNDYAAQRVLIGKLLDKYKKQEDAESRTLHLIETMYESEAKYNLQRCEETWKAQHEERCRELRQLLEDEKNFYGTQLYENRQRQVDLVDMRSAHLTSIDNSNEKLKQLFNEEKNSRTVASDGQTSSLTAKPSDQTLSSSSLSTQNQRRSIPQVSNSFSNLNFDGWQDKPVTSLKGKNANSKSSLSNDSLLPPFNSACAEPNLGRSRAEDTAATSQMYNNEESSTSLHSILKKPCESAPTAVKSSSEYSLPSPRLASRTSIAKSTNSFNNLNLTGWREPPEKRESRDLTLLSQRSVDSQHSLESLTSQRPKFARKRVAWN